MHYLLKDYKGKKFVLVQTRFNRDSVEVLRGSFRPEIFTRSSKGGRRKFIDDIAYKNPIVKVIGRSTGNSGDYKEHLVCEFPGYKNPIHVHPAQLYTLEEFQAMKDEIPAKFEVGSTVYSLPGTMRNNYSNFIIDSFFYVVFCGKTELRYFGTLDGSGRTRALFPKDLVAERPPSYTVIISELKEKYETPHLGYCGPGMNSRLDFPNRDEGNDSTKFIHTEILEVFGKDAAKDTVRIALNRGVPKENITVVEGKALPIQSEINYKVTL